MTASNTKDQGRDHPGVEDDPDIKQNHPDSSETPYIWQRNCLLLGWKKINGENREVWFSAKSRRYGFNPGNLRDDNYVLHGNSARVDKWHSALVGLSGGNPSTRGLSAIWSFAEAVATSQMDQVPKANRVIKPMKRIQAAIDTQRDDDGDDEEDQANWVGPQSNIGKNNVNKGIVGVRRSKRLKKETDPNSTLKTNVRRPSTVRKGAKSSKSIRPQIKAEQDGGAICGDSTNAQPYPTMVGTPIHMLWSALPPSPYGPLSGLNSPNPCGPHSGLNSPNPYSFTTVAETKDFLGGRVKIYQSYSPPHLSTSIANTQSPQNASAMAHQHTSFSAATPQLQPTFPSIDQGPEIDLDETDSQVKPETIG